METPNRDLLENSSMIQLFEIEDFMFMLGVSVVVGAILIEEEVLKTESW